jgi:tRNA(fMet)-specific endonuclease VapC
LFDTTFLVDLVNADAGAARLAEAADQAGSPSYISTVTIHEYLFGVYFRYHGEREALRERIASAERDLSRFEAIPLTPEIVRSSSRVHAELVRSGRTIGINDVFIAATALTYNFALVTRNKTHFGRIPTLRLETY